MEHNWLQKINLEFSEIFSFEKCLVSLKFFSREPRLNEKIPFLSELIHNFFFLRSLKVQEILLCGSETMQSVVFNSTFQNKKLNSGERNTFRKHCFVSLCFKKPGRLHQNSIYRENLWLSRFSFFEILKG